MSDDMYMAALTSEIPYAGKTTACAECGKPMKEGEDIVIELIDNDLTVIETIHEGCL